ncbi:hypothetical protein J7T55_013956 [Diaporthe amygdali]|uniref:uncharacterized protein n=1 Tax=Phomopsis amygdali TaxID=1214568 RepID=UPI0022FDE079|nr:uncharacterized protein J7T55_013956 [Diaporthe amygdali]KAJ0119752.1 hypothetical protein J7T55_013956 [Diaporthe amygdali]
MTDAPMTKTAHKAEEPYTRLHIAPLNPELLKVIVPQAALSKARAISYHTLQAFPDRPYGFIELVSTDAEKIKNKLNGAVLKGVKIRVEPARPDNMPKPDPDALVDAAAGPDSERKSKKSKAEKREKKRKRDPQEIVGIELEEGRKVKRGWTVTPEEAKSKKKKEKEREKTKSKDSKKEKKEKKDKKEKKKRKREAESEYTDGPECLVKTQIPPNKRDVVKGDAQEGESKSKKHKKHDVVVHEFENTTKFPTYFKASKGATTSGTESNFVEGKGWVDSNGVVVEEIKSTRPTALPRIPVEKKAVMEDDDTTSSSGSSSDDAEEESEAEEDADASKQQTPRLAHRALKSLATDTATSAGLDSPPDSARPKSASSAKSLTIKIPPATPSATKVHPLEALYKRQKQDESAVKADAEGNQTFAFFSGQDFEDEEDDNNEGVAGDGPEMDNDESGSQAGPSQGIQLPMTPFSKQDWEWRGTRSAAPTPDTAHPSRYSRLWPPRDASPGIKEGEEEEDDELDSPGGVATEGAGDGEPTNPNTDFQKWFYENRSDLSRSWRKRRKVAAKQKRYRENKARAT